MKELQKRVAEVHKLQEQLTQKIRERDLLIVAAVDSGKTLREVAAIAQLSFPRVQQIVRQHAGRND